MFLPCIVGKRRFTRLVATIKEGEEVATVSDEALTLLALENSCQRWDKIFENSEGKIRHMHKGKTFPETWMDNVPPTEYTKSAKDDPTSSKNTDDKQWNHDGISRFNELRRLIIEDRQAHPTFNIHWLQQVRKSMSSNTPTNDEPSDNSAVDADDDLFMDTLVAPVAKRAKTTTGVDSDSDSTHCSCSTSCSSSINNAVQL